MENLSDIEKKVLRVLKEGKTDKYLEHAFIEHIEIKINYTFANNAALNNGTLTLAGKP